MHQESMVSEVGLWPVEWPQAYAKEINQRVSACFTTRRGGVSQAPWNSLNMGVHVGDNPEHVAQNRHKLLRALCAQSRDANRNGPHGHHLQPIYLKQVHGFDCLALNQDTLRSAADTLEADAALSTEQGIVCTVMVADCLPILFTTLDGQCVASAHAGWRGLLGSNGVGIIENTVQAIRARSNAPVLAWLGPCIGPQAFEVGPEVRAAFSEPNERALFTPLPPGSDAGQEQKYWGNLPALARLRLERLGIPPEAIAGHPSTDNPDWCTYRNARLFFSHRRDSAKLGATGRMAAMIWR